MRKLYNREFYKRRAAEIFEDAFALIVKREYENAFNEFERAFEMDPTNAEYAYYCGLSSYSLDKETSSYYFEQASNLDEGNTKYRLWQGISFYDRKQYEDAKKIFLYAYAINAEDNEIRIYLVKTLNKLKEYDQVINLLENISNPKTIVAEEMFELGFAYLKEYRLENSINSFRLSIYLNDTHKVSYYFLSQTYCKTGEFDKAIKTMKDLKERCPEETNMITEQIKAIELLRSF